MIYLLLSYNLHWAIKVELCFELDLDLSRGLRFKLNSKCVYLVMKRVFSFLNWSEWDFVLVKVFV